MTTVHEARGTFFSLGKKSILNISKEPSPSLTKSGGNEDGNFSSWGDDNNYPHEIIEKADKVSLVVPILDWKSRALYAQGLVYGTLEVDSGKEKFNRIIDSEIEEWMENTDIMQYLLEASSYFYYFYNIFPEIIRSKDKKKIVYLTVKETPDCRWGIKEKSGDKKGYITKCFLGDWKNISDSKEADEIEVVTTFMNPLDQVQTSKKDRFIFPISYPSPGKAYYQKAPWHVLFTSKWYDLAISIPEFKQALMQNQMSIKYLITVPEWWWKWKYKDWDKKSEKDRVEIIKKEHGEFEKFFTGPENQGKSILTTQKDDSHTMKYKEWKVEAIQDTIKEGAYLEDSQEADAHIFKNLNVDPTLFGSGPGKNTTSSGSGSDKRVAFNNYVLQQKAVQDLILKPLHFIAKYNGWNERLAGEGKKLVFWFKNYQIATLDTGKETKEAE